MTLKLSAGPVLAAEERGVHIIFVPDGAVSCGSPGNPTDDELTKVAELVGFPAPTDIIVFCGQSYHFAGEKLKKHPGVHGTNPETVLKLDRRTHDRAVWWSETQFTITGIAQEHPQNSRLAPSPFAGSPVTTREPDSTTGPLWVARSPLPTNNAYGQEYKITFQMEGRTIDPNMECGNN
jgi:hypothetical protein